MVSEMASSDPKLSSQFEEVLHEQMILLREDKDVKDPPQVKTKGRPSNSRLKSAVV
jgi:hypothetical protein